MSINIYERKDMRGGGYAKRKFTFKEAQAIRVEYESGAYTQQQLAIKYDVSQPLITQSLCYKTYTQE